MRSTRTLVGGLILLLAVTAAAASEHAHDDEHAEPERGGHARHGDHSDHPGDLKTIMVELGNDMNAVNAALWVEDWVALAAAGRAIADHPHVSAAEKARVSKALGPDFAAFVAADRRVHDSAVRLSAAATTEDVTAVLGELSELQAACVACHAAFRDRLAPPPKRPGEEQGR